MTVTVSYLTKALFHLNNKWSNHDKAYGELFSWHHIWPLHCWQSTKNWLIFRILDVAMTEYDNEFINSRFDLLSVYTDGISQSRYFCSTNQAVSEIHLLNCLRNMLWPLASNWRHIPRQLENLTHKFIDFYTFVSTGVSYLDMLIKGNVP